MLKQELPAYLSKCAGTAFDHDDVDEFTKGVLLFYKNNGAEFPAWALAACVAFAISPNKAKTFIEVRDDNFRHASRSSSADGFTDH